MESHIKQRTEKRLKRKLRVRKSLRGTAHQPRLSVSKTNRHLSVQLIDDEAGNTLCSFGTLQKGAKVKRKSKEAAQYLGKKIAELAQAKEIERVIFDRGHSKYHGVIAELANAAREAGLKF